MLMTTDSYFAFVLAALALALVPGPTVTVIIANSLKHGARAGLMNVLGTQVGVVIWLAVAALGLGAAIQVMGVWFVLLRYAGAAYLIWLVYMTLNLGATFMVIAAVGDTAYALAAGRAGAWPSRKRIRAIEINSGSFLLGGAAWMVLKGR